MSFTEDFKAFLMRGNVVDLAVAVVVGGAFGKITTAFVDGIIMPPVGLLLGHVDFNNLFLVLKNGTTPPPYTSLDIAKKAGAVVLSYGSFFNTIINFVIIAFAIFVMVEMMAKLKKEPPPADPTTKECPFCVSTIALAATRCPNCTSELGKA
jgi:large conductance mechanosensitive channel